MEDKQYFVLVLAHSLHGRLRRIHIPHQTIYLGFLIVAVSLLTVIGFLSSYVRMSSKVSNYNSLRQEVDVLRAKYKDLQRVTNQKNEQLATLENFASEVSVAYGLKSKTPGVSPEETGLIPTFKETLAQYDFLRTASISESYHAFPKQYQVNAAPTLWPLDGRLMSSFGTRTDPFSGEGALHTGVDLSARIGTPVRATGDGIIHFASWSGGYGKLVVIDHGNGIETYYGHLSEFEVIAGQEIRRGDTIGLSGGTGRSTGPHLHYEIRMGGSPVNPYKYLAPTRVAMAAKASTVHDFPF
jgi:murein DD-endopeptidase MepM/ murein hydrolase activator NlpD